MICWDDNGLAERAQQGDKAAFDVLMTRHQDSTRAYAAERISDWMAAGEIVQDTFLDAWRGIGRFDVQRPFGPWLRAICRNRVRKFCRRAMTSQSLSLSEPDVAREVEALPDARHGTNGPPAVAETLLECLGRLNEKPREALRLRYLEDWPLPAVAARMETSPGCVAQTLLRARQRLRALVLGRG